MGVRVTITVEHTDSTGQVDMSMSKTANGGPGDNPVWVPSQFRDATLSAAAVLNTMLVSNYGEVPAGGRLMSQYCPTLPTSAEYKVFGGAKCP